ncbi:MAG TPA: flagellar biosynthetic protein FliR [Acidimicrobiales bacterium]|nr:flagellar biosynthetic protein FliR [Acidimicrobiales bacterium]
MALALNYQWLVAFLLALARALGWLMLVPPFSNRRVIPPIATTCVASGLALLVAPRIAPSAIPTTSAGLIGDLVLQVVTGVAMGYVVYLLITTITTAGSFVDLTGGLNLPAAIDPLSLDQTPMIGQFFEQVAMVLLLVSGGYLYLVDGFARSFDAPGFTLASTSRIGEVVVLDLATMFTSALEIAAPILVVLFATQIVLAMLSKAAPQMNVWILGMPLQIVLAIVLVGLGISVLPAYLGELVTRALGDTAHLFGGG